MVVCIEGHYPSPFGGMAKFSLKRSEPKEEGLCSRWAVKYIYPAAGYEHRGHSTQTCKRYRMFEEQVDYFCTIFD